jgi:hypothetical protein
MLYREDAKSGFGGIAGGHSLGLLSAYKRPVGLRAVTPNRCCMAELDSKARMMGRQPFAVPDLPQRVREASTNLTKPLTRHVCNRIRFHFPYWPYISIVTGFGG